MAELIKSVKALGEKMTGKEIEGTKLIDVIDETAENYQGGTGSGSEIVDALPAQGKEGNTYLLRKKDESKVFKAQCYAQLYAKSGYTNFDLVMIDADIALLMKEIKTKLNPDLSNGLVDFSQLNSFEQASKSSEEWNTLITSNKVAIVKTEEEVSKITEAVDYIFQDLGEIGVENFIFLELISKDISSGTIYRLAGLLQFLNSYSSSVFVEKLDEMAIFKTRKVVYNSGATSSQPKYSFAEWQDVIRVTLKATLTDAYMYDQETLMSLEDGDCYLINLTPITPEYSYTQYVFDQGVYTPFGGSGARYFLTVYGMTNSAGNYPGQVTIEVDTPNISTVDDLCNWFKAKGFVTTARPGAPVEPMIVYPNAVGVDDNGRFSSGFVLNEDEYDKAIYSPHADLAIYSSRDYTLTYINPKK